MAVGTEADDGEGYAGVLSIGCVTAEAEEFGVVACMDVVAGCHARIACQDGEVGAADAESGAAIVGVAGVRLV